MKLSTCSFRFCSSAISKFCKDQTLHLTHVWLSHLVNDRNVHLQYDNFTVSESGVSKQSEDVSQNEKISQQDKKMAAMTFCLHFSSASI